MIWVFGCVIYLFWGNVIINVKEYLKKRIGVKDYMYINNVSNEIYLKIGYLGYEIWMIEFWYIKEVMDEWFIYIFEGWEVIVNDMLGIIFRYCWGR